MTAWPPGSVVVMCSCRGGHEGQRKRKDGTRGRRAFCDCMGKKGGKKR